MLKTHFRVAKLYEKKKKKKTISQARRHSSKFSIPNLNVSINIVCCLNDIGFDNVLRKISSQLH